MAGPFKLGEKSMVTLIVVFLSFALALAGFLDSNWTVIATAGIAAFNGANAYITGKTAGATTTPNE